MKKVIALALAVLMLATVAFAITTVPDATPGDTLKISREGVDAGNVTVTAKTDVGQTIDMSDFGEAAIAPYIPRSVNSTNYSVTNVKYKMGKGLIESITINDTDDCIEIAMVDDLTNVKAQNFEASFKLKGKAKYTLKDSEEIAAYNMNQKDSAGKTTTKYLDPDDNTNLNKKVTLPSLDFEISGTVGYGKISISLGNDGDEEIESLAALVKAWSLYSDGTKDEDIINNNVFQFKRNSEGNPGKATKDAPMAGAYTADAILTQEYGDALTMEARVYHNDKLYFGIKYTPDKGIVKRLADADGDLDFYRFSSNKDYVTFNSNVKLYFNDADEDSFVYRVNDNGYLVPTGEFSEEDGCWVVKTRTLGTYVVSDIELDDTVVATGDAANGNPDTGANDVVGIATALAAVALVSAAAISLKK